MKQSDSTNSGLVPATPATSSPSQLLQFPTPPSSPPKFASLDSASLVPDLEFDLLEAIRQAQQAQPGQREKITLYGFPSYLALNIRRVLSRGGKRLDWSTALSCLLWQGLLRYNSLSAAQDLAASLLDLDTDDNLDAVAAEQVEMWRRGFRFAISDPTHSMGLEKARSWRAPEYIHSDLYDAAGRIGCSGSALGTVCIMASLASQLGVLEDHENEMRAVVAEFDGLLKERHRRLQGLLAVVRSAVGAGARAVG